MFKSKLLSKKLSLRFVIFTFLGLFIVRFIFVVFPRYATDWERLKLKKQTAENLILIPVGEACPLALDKISKLNTNEQQELLKKLILIVQKNQNGVKTLIENKKDYIEIAQKINEDGQPNILNSFDCLFASLRNLSNLSSLRATVEKDYIPFLVGTNQWWRSDDYFFKLYSQNLAHLLKTDKYFAPIILEQIFNNEDMHSNFRVKDLVKQNSVYTIDLYIKKYSQENITTKEKAEYLNIFTHLICQRVINEKIINYLSDHTQSKDKRLDILNIFNYCGTRADDYKQLLQSFVANNEKELANKFNDRIDKSGLKKQEDLNLVLKVLMTDLDNINFDSSSDWSKLEEIQSKLRQFGGKDSNLDFSEVGARIIKIFDMIGNKVGFNTPTFRNFSLAVVWTPIRMGVSSYFLKLMEQKEQRGIAIEILKNYHDQTVVTEVINKLLNELKLGKTEEEKIEILNLIMSFDEKINKVRSDNLTMTLIDLLGDQNDQIVEISFYMLISSGESMLPLLRKKMDSSNLSDQVKLNLLRTISSLSSIAKSFSDLEAFMNKTSSCNYSYAISFLHLISKKDDSTQTPISGMTNINTVRINPRKRHLSNRNYSQNTIIVNLPQKEIFATYLTCPLKYLDFEIIKEASSKNIDYQNILNNEIAKSSQEKKDFLSGKQSQESD